MQRILNDLYDISQRVREIDEGYYVVYNKRFSRFEVRSESTLSLVLTAEKLDARIIERLMRARNKNVFDIAREIEQHNERIDKANEAFALGEAEYLITHNA